jgi:lipid A 3-O-deacylase
MQAMKKIIVILLLLPLSVFAKPSLLFVGGGLFDVTRRYPKGMVQLEYKPSAEVIMMRPVVGAFMTTLASTYFYGGFAFDLPLGKKFIVAPGFAPGLYLKGQGKDLGCLLEFRSCIELSAVLKNSGRFTTQFFHVSNAHLGWRNPGINAVVAGYSIPL